MIDRVHTPVRRVWPAGLTLIALIAVWEVWVDLAQIDQSLLPPPSAIFRGLRSDAGELASVGWSTLRAALIGLLVATLLAVLIAALIDASTVARRALEPLLVASQTLPIIAIAPLLVIWTSFEPAKVLVVALYALFPIAVGIIRGLEQTDPEAINLVRTMGAGRWRTLATVRVPSAAASIFTGMRLAAAYAVPAALVGEYVGGGGLGQYMLQASHGGATDLVFAGVVVSVALTFALYVAIVLIERVAAPWLRQTQ